MFALQVSKEQWVKNFGIMQYPGDAERVFRYLDADHSNFITLAEIDEKANEVRRAGVGSIF